APASASRPESWSRCGPGGTTRKWRRARPPRSCTRRRDPKPADEALLQPDRRDTTRLPPNDAFPPVLPGHGRWVRGHVRSGSKASAFRPSIVQGKPVARRGRKARDLPTARSELRRGRPAAGEGSQRKLRGTFSEL